MAAPRVKRIFLIRHAESEGNVDQRIHATLPDHTISLSEKGLEQARAAGEFLVNWLETNVPDKIVRPVDRITKNQVRVWNSPYKRTRHTANIISGCLAPRNWLLDQEENILLCEQQFGLFDGLPDEELPVKYPNEYAHYKKCEDFEGRFWARLPMGESRFDVCQRIQQSFGTFIRDAERHDVENIAIVSHGVTNRAFRTMWMHHPWEWFESEKNPGNASISLIEYAFVSPKGWQYVDRGYIFEGFSK